MGKKINVRTLVTRLAGAGIFLTLGIGTLWWAGSAAVARGMVIAASPDLNGDGAFTVLDIPQATWSVFIAAGDQIQADLASTEKPLLAETARFIELSANEPRWLWSLVLTLLSYGMGIGWIAIGLLVPFARSDELH